MLRVGLGSLRRWRNAARNTRRIGEDLIGRTTELDVPASHQHAQPLRKCTPGKIARMAVIIRALPGVVTAVLVEQDFVRARTCEDRKRYAKHPCVAELPDVLITRPTTNQGNDKVRTDVALAPVTDSQRQRTMLDRPCHNKMTRPEYRLRNTEDNR